MIIDAHCHLLPPDFSARHGELSSRDATYAALFPDSGGGMADLATLLRDMDAGSVDRAVVMGFGWTDQAVAAWANDYLLAAAATHSDRLTAFVSVNPAWGESALTEARRCFDSGAAGIGELHPDTQGFDITDSDTMAALMGELRARNLPITIHASEPVGHQYPGKGTTTPNRLLTFAEYFPHNRIVFAHLGGGLPFYHAMPEVAASLANVWYDTAALPFLYRPSAIGAAVATAGSDRILFASDYPLMSYRKVKEHVRSAGLDAGQLNAIMGGNAKRLLGLPEP